MRNFSGIWESKSINVTCLHYFEKKDQKNNLFVGNQSWFKKQWEIKALISYILGIRFVGSYVGANPKQNVYFEQS